MYKWVAELTSPKYNGRLSGSPGYIAAAEGIASNLRKWGIKPGGDDGDYFQWFDKGYNEVHVLGRLCLHIPVKDGKVINKYYPFPDHYHRPGDTAEMVTPEVMEDVSKLLYIALTRIAREEKIR